MTTSGAKRKYLLSPISHLLSPICLALCALACNANAQAPGIRRLPTRPVPAGRQQPAEQPQPTAAEYDGPTYKKEDFEGTNAPALKFDNAPADILLQTYAEVTGKTLLEAPNLPKATITLKSEQTELTKEEFLQAIETILVMNNIALVPDGEKFIRVFPANELRTDGVKTHFSEPEGGAHVEDGKMVSQMITLKNISLEEAKKAIEGFKRKEGLIQTFERTNSVLITDTVENVNRMMEILKFIDQPLVNRDEVNVRPLKFAKAADIKKRLEEIVAESQKEQQQNKQTTAPEAKTSGSPGIIRRNVPGVVRPGQVAQPETPVNNTIETLIDEADRGMIKGKVQIIADERTNLLIIITRPENMVFFNRIIDVLDVEVQTAPDVIVEVIRLKHALAKDVAQMLNDLISKNDTKKKSETDAETTVADKNDDTGSRSLTEAADRTRRRPDAAAQTGHKEPEAKGRLGELRKEDISILADERANAIVVMAAPLDVKTIRDIIRDMDIQLSQVVIETVIVSVSFGDRQETGMDWVQNAMLTTTGNNATPRFAFATAGGGGSGTPVDVPSFSPGKTGGVSGWFTIFDLNMNLILTAVQSDSRSRLMSSPRITTMDNKEATLEAKTRTYWNEGTTYYNYSGSDNRETDNIKSEDIGITLKVTPRINKNGYITLTIEQEIQNIDRYDSEVTQKGNKYPIISTRKMGADVAVYSGETVVLGGLAQNQISKQVTKVPILGSIPLLGWLFRYTEEKSDRTEVIVFLTPRIVDTPADMEDDARKLKASMGTEGVWDSSWSSSRLADPLNPKQARHVIENGLETVVPPRYPLTGYLTGLNDTNLINQVPAISNAVEQTPPGQIPYIHFSDVDINSRIVPGSIRYEESVETNAPPAP